MSRIVNPGEPPGGHRHEELPLPITHAGFSFTFTLDDLQKARDLRAAEEAGRRLAESIERPTLGVDVDWHELAGGLSGYDPRHQAFFQCISMHPKFEILRVEWRIRYMNMVGLKRIGLTVGLSTKTKENKTVNLLFTGEDVIRTTREYLSYVKFPRDEEVEYDPKTGEPKKKVKNAAIYQACVDAILEAAGEELFWSVTHGDYRFGTTGDRSTDVSEEVITGRPLTSPAADDDDDDRENHDSDV